MTFWIGLALLVCLWFSCSKGPRKYQIMALVFTLSYLYFVPAIIKVPVWISESYYPFGESLLINTSGHLVPRPDAPLVSYHNWPLYVYFASVFKLVTGMADSVILRYFPLLTISLYAIFSFLILKAKLSTSYAILGAALFLGSFFTRQQYFGPQGIAFVFFLLTIFIVSRLFFDETTKKKGTLAVIYIFLFCVVTLTHALTSLMTLLVVVAGYLAYRILRKQPPAFAAQLCLFSAVFLLAYNLFAAQSFFNQTVETLSEFLSGPEEASLLKEPTRIVSSGAQRLNYYASWGIVLLMGGIAAIQLLYLLRNLRSRKQRNNEVFSFFMAIWLVLAVLFGVSAVYGSHEAYQRAFMFGLVPITYLCLNFFAKKRRVLLIILAGLLFLNIVAQYGSDTYRLEPYESLAGTKFLVDVTPRNISCLYGFWPHIRYQDPLKRVQFYEVRGTLPYNTVPNASEVQKTLGKSEYIIRSELQRKYYLYFFGLDPLDQVSLDGFDRVYDNADFRIFTHANETSSP